MLESEGDAGIHGLTRLAVGCAVLLVVVMMGLVIGARVLIRARRIDEERRATTLLLDQLVREVKSGTSTDAARKRVLVDTQGEISKLKVFIPGTPYYASQLENIAALRRSFLASALDAWGHPIYYRCPGPIHKNGWDLISCGPNGVFENGGGDDIVVGEDLPGGIASIASESGTTPEAK